MIPAKEPVQVLTPGSAGTLDKLLVTARRIVTEWSWVVAPSRWPMAAEVDEWL